MIPVQRLEQTQRVLVTRIPRKLYLLLIPVQGLGQTQRVLVTRIPRKIYLLLILAQGTDRHRGWLPEQRGNYLLILVKRMGLTQSDGYQNKEESIC